MNFSGKQTTRVVRMSLFTAAAAVAVLLAAGCGKAIRYDLERGTTLVYTVVEQLGKVVEEEEVYASPFEIMEVRMRVKQKLSGKTTIMLTAHPGGRRVDAAFGRDLGQLDLKIDDTGNVIEVYGMGIPQEVRFFIPELPEKMKKGTTWVEDIKIKYKSNILEAELKHEFQGMKEAAGRRCYFIKGTALFKHKETVNNQELGVNASMEFVFEYFEDYYFDIGRGHIVKTEIFQKRKRTIIDNITGNVELDEMDMNRKTIELQAVED